LIKSFASEGNTEIEILNGRFGPYIKAGKKNVKIPKGKEPKDLTLEECITLAANAPESKGRFGRFARKKETPAEAPKPAVKAAKKTAVKKAPKKAAKKVARKPVAKKAAKKTSKK